MASGAEADRSGDLARDAAAYELLESARWRDGPPSCPHCATPGRSRLLVAAGGLARRTRTGRWSARRVWRCGHCRRQFSVLTGTVFEGTRVPLPVWLDALRILSAGPDGCPDGELARSVGVSVDTARAMAHLVRTGLSVTVDPDGAGPQPQG